MTIFTHPVRVYWEDTDASGLVYHASYIRFMERGRTELLRELHLNQRHLLERSAESPAFFVVRAMQLDFRRSAVMDDLLSVETRVTELGGASMTMAQRIMRGAETLATATVKVVFVENGQPKRIPHELREKFAGIAEV